MRKPNTAVYYYYFTAAAILDQSKYQTELTSNHTARFAAESVRDAAAVVETVQIIESELDSDCDVVGLTGHNQPEGGVGVK